MDIKNQNNGLLSFVKALSMIIVVCVFSYKVFETPINLTIDFPTLLSLLLALFSVGLAALFYFKATDTSNTFYDNTNKFTRDIANLLAKMESGFGERLKHLDEGYSSVRDHLQQIPNHPTRRDAVATKTVIDTEKQELEKTLTQRNEFINELVDQSQMKENEKSAALARLMEMEKEAKQTQMELDKLNKKLTIERMQRHQSSRKMLTAYEDHTIYVIVPRMGIENILNWKPSRIAREFDIAVKGSPDVYFEDMRGKGYMLNRLTHDGVEFIKSIAREIQDK